MGFKIFCMALGIPSIAAAIPFIMIAVRNHLSADDFLYHVVLPVFLLGGFGIGIIIFGFLKKFPKENSLA